METSDAAFMATPQDLEAHSVSENTLLQLLPPEAINPLLFPQQEASANAPSQPSSSSAPSLNLPLPTADTRSTQAVLVHATTSQTNAAANAATSSQQPSTSAAPSTSRTSRRSRSTLNLTLETLSPRHNRMIHCILSVLNHASEPLSKPECIDAINATYTDFSHLASSSPYSHCFPIAIRLGLIGKIGRQNSFGGIKYRILPAGVNFISNP